MKIKFLLLSIYLTSFVSAFAEEHEAAHHEPSAFDLKYPALNFVLFAGFIIFKARKPLTEMFDKKASEIRAMMESANKQSADANAKLIELQNKLKNIDAELVKISTDYESDIVNYGKIQNDETTTTLARMKKDIESKLEGEKAELMAELSHELLNLVVSKTKNSINSNNDLKTKATNNIIAGLK